MLRDLQNKKPLKGFPLDIRVRDICCFGPKTKRDCPRANDGDPFGLCSRAVRTNVFFVAYMLKKLPQATSLAFHLGVYTREFPGGVRF